MGQAPDEITEGQEQANTDKGRSETDNDAITSPKVDVAEVKDSSDGEENTPALQLFIDHVKNIAQATSLALGAMSASHVVTHLSASAIVHSFPARIGFGALVGGGVGLLGKTLVNHFGGQSSRELWSTAQRGKAVIRFVCSSLGFVAFWSGPVFWLQGAYTDHSKNQQVLSNVQADKDEIESWQDTPFSLPAVQKIAIDLHEDIIESTGTEGQMTPASLAKMALYFDGLRVEWNPDIPPDLAEDTASVVEFQNNGQKWRIQTLNPASWLVMGETESWWISEDANGADTVTTFMAAFPRDKEMSDLKMTLNESGKFDGRTALQDLIIATGEFPLLSEHFLPKRELITAALPFETNEQWRRKTLSLETDEVSKWNEAVTVQVSNANDNLFGASSLGIEDSYGTLSAKIENTL